jgi:putative FmdB family regulatory protein
MATYEYRCDRDGVFDAMYPIGTAPQMMACPACTAESARVFSKPMLFSTPKELVAALDHEEKTRHEPDVVTSLPPAGARKRTPVLPLTPTLSRLPRP